MELSEWADWDRYGFRWLGIFSCPDLFFLTFSNTFLTSKGKLTPLRKIPLSKYNLRAMLKKQFKSCPFDIQNLLCHGQIREEWQYGCYYTVTSTGKKSEFLFGV